jgi:hypothetical protein
MLYISNRGNINGPDLGNENNPVYVKATLDRGYHVVVDVWIVQQKEGLQLALGELQPQYPVTIELLKNPKIIARVNNLTAFQILLDNGVHVVGNSRDFCLTSRGLIWTPPGSRIVTVKSVMNMPEWYTNNMKDLAFINCAAICSNFIERVSTTREALRKAAEDQKKTEESKELNTIPEESNEDDSITLELPN